MPRTYAKASMANVTGQQLYNAIITDTPALQNGGLPFAATSNYPDGETNSRVIGELLYNNINLSNQFIPALLNGVAIKVVQSRYWEDPWVGLEKGKLDYGEFIEEIFIKMAKPHSFDQARAEQEVFKREIPNVMTAFHALNYQKFYKQTISNEELRMAFASWGELTRFIADIIQNMFTSANYDVFQTKLYMIARAIITGSVGVTEVSEITDKTTAEDAVALARTLSLNLLQLSGKYNYYGVPNYTPLEDQIIIINNSAAGRIDVSVLAADFNMDKAEFLTVHRLAVTSFGDLDTARLAELYAGDASYVEISADEMAQLDKIPFAIFDRRWFQIYDYFNGVTNIYNPEGLYWNYDYHVWKVFGVSPFANAQVFGTTAPAIGSVTVNPSALTITAGQSAQVSANVTTTGFAPQTVNWSSDTEGISVSQNGVIKVASNVAPGTSATITATSTFDATKTGTSTVTVA